MKHWLFFWCVVANGLWAGEMPRQWDTLVAGGDTVLARWQHDLVARHGVDWPLAGVKPVLASADAALCNLECCVSLRGEPAEKGERCSFFYRARPEMLQCLTRAGIDMVTAANNHGGDYGPVSVSDTVYWTGRAGLACIGAGETLAEAEKPRVLQVGRTQVGILGMDTTMPFFAARPGRPGTNYINEQGDLSDFKAQLARWAPWMAAHCHLWVLTLHWGNNWVRETQATHRRMARMAVDHGVDLILGHSAHRLQGIELIRGKPVIYDMGNLLFDCKLSEAGQQSALFRMALSPRGVHRIEVIPVEALTGHSVLARGDAARAILAEMADLCRPFQTPFAVRAGGADSHGLVGVIDIPVAETGERKKTEKPAAVKNPPASLSGEAARAGPLPANAVKQAPAAALMPGVLLEGFVLPKTAAEGGILPIATWLRITAKVDANILVAYHLQSGTETYRRGTPWYTRHDAADWTLPLCRMAPGERVKDAYPARLSGLPAGPCRVSICLINTALPEGRRVVGKPFFMGTVMIR